MRNTVVGNVEIGTSTGDKINIDLSRANETTRDRSSTTNINVESQTIEYALNPSKFKEDVGKAKQEIQDIGRAINESINDKGDDNRNFFGQLREIRLNETIYNIAGERLKNSETSEEITDTFVKAYRDLGEEINVIYSTPDKAPQLYDEKGRELSGTSFIDRTTGKKTIIINVNSEDNETKAGLIGTIAEEGSHIINGSRNRHIETGTDELGLESTGRATNEYFKDKYKGDNKNINLSSDGKDYSNVDFGERQGDSASSVNRARLIRAIENADKKLKENHKDKNQYFSVLEEIGKYAGSTKGNPYEALYMIPTHMRKNVMDANGYLNIKDFDPEGWERVSKRAEYNKAVSKTLDLGKEKALRKLSENPNVSFKEVRSESNDKISEGFKLVGSERGIIGNRVAKTLEYALGSSVVTGTALIYRNVKQNGEVELKINVRYNLSDAFEDTLGVKNRKRQLNELLGKKIFNDEKGIEYGTPYSMIGPSNIRTVFHRTFKSNQEYLNFLRNR